MAELDDLPELIEVPVVAQYLGVSEETVRRMLRDGRLVGVYITRWRVPKDELRRFVEERKGVRPARRGGPRRRDETHGPVSLAGGRVYPGSEAEPAGDDEPEDDEPGGDKPAAGARPALGARHYVFSAERVAPPRIIG